MLLVNSAPRGRRGAGTDGCTSPYRYAHDRGRRTLTGIAEQVAEAENAVAGRTPVKHNRFVRLRCGDPLGQSYSRNQGGSSHLSVAFAALALSRRVEGRTGMSIKKFVKTTRRYREVVMAAGA